MLALALLALVAGTPQAARLARPEARVRTECPRSNAGTSAEAGSMLALALLALVAGTPQADAEVRAWFDSPVKRMSPKIFSFMQKRLILGGEVLVMVSDSVNLTSLS